MDMMKHITGLFDEHGDQSPGHETSPRASGSNMKITALCTIGKPAIIWNHGPKSNTDMFLQSHLLLGVNFMVPFVNNDHSIHYPVDDSVYTAYGPLFAQLRSLQWVLAPHAVRVLDNEAQANFFHTKYGFAAFVAFPKANATRAELSLRGVRTTEQWRTLQHGGVRVSALYPDGQNPGPSIPFKVDASGAIVLTVSLGGNPAAACAMILITDSSQDPLVHPQPREYS